MSNTDETCLNGQITATLFKGTIIVMIRFKDLYECVCELWLSCLKHGIEKYTTKEYFSRYNYFVNWLCHFVFQRIYISMVLMKVFYDVF